MQGKFKMLLRSIAGPIRERLMKGQSIFLLGPRQVGKTTLIGDCLAGIKPILSYPLQDPRIRLELETNPGRLIQQVEALPKPPLVFLDEAQKVPELLDAVQYLIDEGKGRFIITGSSARKLRRRGTNLLPGRVRSFRLDPLSWGELGWVKPSEERLLQQENLNIHKGYSFDQALVYGTLPGIVRQSDDDERRDILKAYTSIYLEEEIRAEALSRNMGAFSRFLELAARESGGNPNFSTLSREAGVSVPTVKGFYAILDDTLVVERVEPFMRKTRKRILATPRYYFFDLGVRNALARLPLNLELVNADAGRLFEHAVILEIIRRIRCLRLDWRVHYWRTSGGAEVDCVIDTGEKLIPIEIKSGTSLGLGALKGLMNFMDDYGLKQGWVIFRGRIPERLNDRIMALPWQNF
jgi:uncharacterized protein